MAISNRSDVCEAFGVSVPQASTDVRRWMTLNDGAIVYNKSAKRYESTTLQSIKPREANQ